MSIKIASTQDVTPEILQSDTSFRSNIESSIAEALGVIDGQVSVTKVAIDSRRLQSGNEGSGARRLNNAGLKVDYEVYMDGSTEALRIKSSMMEASTDSQGDFAKAFRENLQAKEKASGRTLVVDSMSVASVDLVDRSISISDAKVAAKEKAMATTTTTTSTSSTSKKPTMVSATAEDVYKEAPATTTPASKSAIEDAAGAASEIVPQLWMAVLAILAYCN